MPLRAVFSVPPGSAAVAFEASAVAGLAWCGLSWDEGPFYQSLRLDRYREMAKQLEESKRAYWKEDPDKGKALYFAIDRGRVGWKDLIHAVSSAGVPLNTSLSWLLASPYCQIFQACQGAGAVGVADWKMASHSGYEPSPAQLPEVMKLKKE